MGRQAGQDSLGGGQAGPRTAAREGDPGLGRPRLSQGRPSAHWCGACTGCWGAGDFGREVCSAVWLDRACPQLLPTGCLLRVEPQGHPASRKQWSSEGLLVRSLHLPRPPQPPPSPWGSPRLQVRPPSTQHVNKAPSCPCSPRRPIPVAVRARTLPSPARQGWILIKPSGHSWLHASLSSRLWPWPLMDG